MSYVLFWTSVTGALKNYKCPLIEHMPSILQQGIVKEP